MNITLDELAMHWLNAKQREEDGRRDRVEIEERMLEMLEGQTKEEGTTTHACEGGSVKVTGKLTRSLDAKAWSELEGAIPEDLRPVSYEPKLDLKGLRYLEASEPEVYAKVVTAITTKPAKSAIKVEVSRV